MKQHKLTLIGLILFGLNLSACQPTSIKQEKGVLDYFRCTLGTPSPTHRTCFANLPPPSQRNHSTVFLLAGGANTGKLKETSTDINNFAKAMQQRFAIPEEQICLLPNVYRAELELALQSLHQQIRKQDLAIIYFSGHGSWVGDNNGDEKDRRDEVLVTYDVKCKHRYDVKEEDSLRDDRFVQLINTLPTDRVLTVLDTCFSAGMYLGPNNPEPLPSKALSKFMVKGPFGNQDSSSAYHANNLIENEVGNMDSLKGLLLAAATEEEKALEISKGGLFTLKLLTQLQKYANWRTAFKQATKQIQKHKPPQTPQAIGKWEILEP